jgi:hypothetical protein
MIGYIIKLALRIVPFFFVNNGVLVQRVLKLMKKYFDYNGLK